MLGDTPQKRQLLLEGGGFTQIFGPDAKPLCEPLPETVEGLLFADVDLGFSPGGRGRRRRHRHGEPMTRCEFQAVTDLDPSLGSDASSCSTISMSTGFVRWKSKPASLARWRSCSAPQPVKAISVGPLPRSAWATS